MSDQAQISGSVERITYHNEENGYTVLRLKPDERGMLPFQYGQPLITVVGNLPDMNPGEWLRLTGQWTTHPRHGRQFQAEHCEQALPATAEGVRRYLGSGMIRGVGKVMAERIVDRFGAETLEIIERDPKRLYEVPGIGRKRIDGIIAAWEEQRDIKEVMLFLHAHHVPTHLAVKIYKQYGDQSLAVVQNTPYRLVRDVYGIGFKTADQIARSLGLANDDPARIEAGIAYTLTRMAEQGHVFVPEAELEPEAAEILGLDEVQVRAVLSQLARSEFVRRDTVHYKVNERPQNEPALAEEQAVYLPQLYHSEVGLSRELQRVVWHPTSRLAPLRERADQEMAQQSSLSSETGVVLSDLQQEAITTTLSHKVTVLTGGPGTGKTTTLRTLLDLLDRRGHSSVLASPTGRAAKRLTETTGRPARTIHRLLEFKPGEGFQRNDGNPIDADLVIIDEASMLDLSLAHNLVRAVGSDSHLLLVGDVDQLPSVGPGDVLRDLISSGVPAVVRLETIFRQAAGSLIVRNAHRINQGQMPETDQNATDFFMFVKEDPDETAELIVDIVRNRAPLKFGFDPLEDIQVLAPMYNGAAGVTNLNQTLQAALNPPGRRKSERKTPGRVLRVGDKVMQTTNDYDKNVYNGDIGRVTAMDAVEQQVTVSVDGAPVVYDFTEADELMLAYAISVHKSQGSEYPCVVIPVVTQHYLMLQRNLIYTAITRAKKVAILVGTRKALAIAVNNDRMAKRYTALDWRLQH